MALDMHDFPRTPPKDFGSARRQPGAVALWLFLVCAMLLVMIVLGGATRLTGSGLSIMEWAPLLGALPPVSEVEWQRLFSLYKSIPQYTLLHPDMDLSGFQRIFWLEWIHRLWGRLLGVVFLVPLVWFWARGRIERELRGRLVVVFLVGGLQGAVGWFMVASGFFADSTAVSAYRLVIHLGLALLLYAVVLWTALSLWRPLPAPGAADGGARRIAAAACMVIVLTILAGGFVAGLHAGRTFNSFPLMDGRLVPADYASLTPFWRNFTENVAAVQFDHRLLASLSLLAALAAGAAGRRLPGLHPARRALAALIGLIATQYALGVTTLLLVVPVALAVAHQAVAVLVLTAALAALHALRAPPQVAS